MQQLDEAIEATNQALLSDPEGCGLRPPDRVSPSGDPCVRTAVPAPTERLRRTTGVLCGQDHVYHSDGTTGSGCRHRRHVMETPSAMMCRHRPDAAALVLCDLSCPRVLRSGRSSRRAVAMEEDMLDFAFDVRPTSRLSCQSASRRSSTASSCTRRRSRLRLTRPGTGSAPSGWSRRSRGPVTAPAAPGTPATGRRRPSAHPAGTRARIPHPDRSDTIGMGTAAM